MAPKLILLPETLYFEVQKTVCLGKLHKNFYSAFSQSLHLSLKNSENMTTSRKSLFRCLHLLPKIEKLFKCKCLSLFLVFVYFFVDFECPGESFSDLKRQNLIGVGKNVRLAAIMNRIFPSKIASTEILIARLKQPCAGGLYILNNSRDILSAVLFGGGLIHS